MVDIAISEEQREYLEQLRERLAVEHVGEYGHVRTRDALQYLIDQHEVDDPSAAGDAPAATSNASASEGTASTPDLEPDAALDPDPESEPSTTHAERDDADESTTAAAERAEAAENADEPVEEAKGDTAGENADDEASDESDGDAGGSGGPGRLQQMMTLLDDHEDKWDAVDSNQGKYVVELPDGEHEFARTKDDVRAVLFKHYR